MAQVQLLPFWNELTCVMLMNDVNIIYFYLIQQKTTQY
jgi:hypothetical protein